MRPLVDARIGDAGLAVAVTLVLAVVIATDPAGRVSVGGYAFAFAFGGSLLLRRRFPRTLLVVTVPAVFVYYTLDLPPVGMVLPALGALFSGAEQRRTAWATGAAAVLLAVATAFRLTGNDADPLRGYSLVTELALAAASIALGAAVRLAREARERSIEVARLTEVEARHEADTRMQQERLRIARDLHDTIGHTLSVASLHAGVAAEEEDSEQRRDALDRVRNAAGEALREMRRTVRFLRADETSDADAPPGLTGIDDLVASARESALVVETELTDADVPSSVGAVAFRIVQEALTNVMRHSDAQTVRITTSLDRGVLTVRVADDGTSPARVQGGSGIRGMHERAALVGGDLDASSTPHGFVVEARLPAPEKDQV